MERSDIVGLNCERLTPHDSREGKLVLYLHGGAYLMGSSATHRQFVSYIAKAAGVAALLPEYRLAPEHPFPAAIDDAVRLYRSLLRLGYSAQDIVIAGDSAGGGLSMATVLSLRDAREPLPAAVCLLSPWLDLTASGESMISNASRDPWFRPDDMPIVADYYCRPEQRRHPLVSPVYADFEGLPPLYIQVGSDEILLSDATRAAERARAAGGKAEIEIWDNMWHVFQAFARHVPESRAAVNKMGAYIRQVFDVPCASES